MEKTLKTHQWGLMYITANSVSSVQCLQFVLHTPTSALFLSYGRISDS